MPLEIKNLAFRYHPESAPILKDVSLTLKAGECAGIAGCNGSGKSTLIAAVCGLIPGFGKGILSGEIITENPPPAAVLQNLDAQILTDTVRDEISFFASYTSHKNPSFTPETVAERAGLGYCLDRKVFLLSTGEKQRLALACAVASAHSGLIVLDEPSAYLDDDGAEKLSGMLAALKENGHAVLIVGHEFSRLKSAVDKSYVLGNGVLSESPVADSHCAVAKTGREKTAGPSVLRANGITFRSESDAALVNDLNFEIKTGLITGLTGPNGSGKSTFAKIAAGHITAHDGTISVNGRETERGELLEKVRLISQNPYTSLLYKTVGENLARAAREAKTRAPYDMENLAATLGVLRLYGRTIQSLSYGQAQRCALLCAAAANPDFLIIDEAVSCLDREGVEAFHSAMDIFARAGKGVLVISHLNRLTAEIADELHAMPLCPANGELK